MKLAISFNHFDNFKTSRVLYFAKLKFTKLSAFLWVLVGMVCHHDCMHCIHEDILYSKETPLAKHQQPRILDDFFHNFKVFKTFYDLYFLVLSSFSLSFSCFPSLLFSYSLTQTQNTQIYSHTHFLFLSLTISLSHSLTLSLSYSLTIFRPIFLNPT